jgi:hypothetical protein
MAIGWGRGSERIVPLNTLLTAKRVCPNGVAAEVGSIQFNREQSKIRAESSAIRQRLLFFRDYSLSSPALTSPDPMGREGLFGLLCNHSLMSPRGVSASLPSGRGGVRGWLTDG